MRFFISLVFVLFLTQLALGLPSRFEGEVERVDYATRTMRVRTSQGIRVVEVGSNTKVTEEGRSVGLREISIGEHVLVDGIVLNNNKTVATSVVAHNSYKPYYQQGPSMNPAPNSQTGNTRPEIRVTFSEPISKAQLWVDGTDFSGQTRVSGESMTWRPPYNLDYGLHHVRVVGHAAALGSEHLDADWSFSISRGGRQWPDSHSGQLWPTPGTTVNTARPQIGALFPENVRNIHLVIDGQDFTNRAAIWGNRVSWTPTYNLDSQVHHVAIRATGSGGHLYTQDWNFTVPSWAEGGSQSRARAAHLTDYGPAPGSVVTVTRPKISCRFSSRVSSDSIRMSVDGHDVTASARRDSDDVSWTPAYNLDYGQHVVRVTATDRNGQNVRGEWTFVIAR